MIYDLNNLNDTQMNVDDTTTLLVIDHFRGFSDFLIDLFSIPSPSNGVWNCGT